MRGVKKSENYPTSCGAGPRAALPRRCARLLRLSLGHAGRTMRPRVPRAVAPPHGGSTRPRQPGYKRRRGILRQRFVRAPGRAPVDIHPRSVSTRGADWLDWVVGRLLSANEGNVHPLANRTQTGPDMSVRAWARWAMDRTSQQEKPGRRGTRAMGGTGDGRHAGGTGDGRHAR